MWLSKLRTSAERNQLYFSWGTLAEAQLRTGDLAAADQSLANALIAVRPQFPQQNPDRWSLELDEAEHRLLHRDYAAARSILEQPTPTDLPAMERKRAAASPAGFA